MADSHEIDEKFDPSEEKKHYEEEDKKNFESTTKENENQALIELYKKFMNYKNNLFKLEALISLENDQSSKEELQSMKSDLLQAISYQEDVIKFTQNKDDFYFSVERLTSDSAGNFLFIFHLFFQ